MSRTLSDAEFAEARRAVIDYVSKHRSITNRHFRELTKLSYDQAIAFFNRMIKENALLRVGKGSGTKYVLPE